MDSCNINIINTICSGETSLTFYGKNFTTQCKLIWSLKLQSSKFEKLEMKGLNCTTYNLWCPSKSHVTCMEQYATD